MKKALVAVMVLVAFIAMNGCKDKTALNNGVPEKLLIGIYGGDNPAQTKGALEPFRLYFEKKMGMPVEFLFTTDYTAVIEALRSKKIHMAELTPFAYVLATQKPGLEPIATLGVNHQPTLYHSIIFTNRGTGIKTMDDVKARAKNITLCFADPASTSGHLIPRAYLNSIGLDPDHAFKQTIFAGSHAASILSVKSGKIDIGCSTGELSLDKLIREGIVKREDIVILWTSPPIVNDPITVRSDLNRDFIKKIQAVYFSVAKENYRAFSSYVKLYYPQPQKMEYMPIQDSMYNGLRKIAGNTKELKLNK